MRGTQGSIYNFYITLLKRHKRRLDNLCWNEKKDPIRKNLYIFVKTL